MTKTKPKNEEKTSEIVKEISKENSKQKKKNLKIIKKAAQDKIIKAPVAVPAKSLSESSEPQKETKQEDPAKKAKRDAKKLKQKMKKAEDKEKTAGSAVGKGQTIFVGNVPCNTKRVQLVKLFAPFGNVLSVRFRTPNGKVIFKHKMRTESAAIIAYVVFDNSDSATKALELNGTEFKGQVLRIQKSETAKEAVDPKNTVLVGNLKESVTDDKLHQIFSSCGEIEYVRALQSSGEEGCNGTAFVRFKNPDAVGLALELKGTMLDERPIRVERYSVNKAGASKKRNTENKNNSGKGNLAKLTPLQRAALEYKKKAKQPKGQKKKFIGKPKPGKPTTAAKKPEGEKKKKSEYRGVKADNMKKKPKKKVPSQMKRLANKIAPRD